MRERESERESERERVRERETESARERLSDIPDTRKAELKFLSTCSKH